MESGGEEGERGLDQTEGSGLRRVLYWDVNYYSRSERHMAQSSLLEDPVCFLTL